MASFTKALTPLIRLEGGHVHDPDDFGGETIYGISKRYWPEYWEDGPPDEEDAKDFYANEFWHPLRLGEIHDQRIATEMLDLAVHLGHARAVRFLQWAINAMDQRSIRELAVDGRIGPRTLDAVNRLSWQNTQRVFKVLNGIQFSYYVYRTGQMDGMVSLFRTTEDETQDKFFRGWLRRVGFDA